MILNIFQRILMDNFAGANKWRRGGYHLNSAIPLKI